MKTFLSSFLLLFVTLISFSQTIETDSISKAKMSELQFLVGNWEGKGWMKGREGMSNFNQTENVQFKLDSTAILIEGIGKSNGKIIHNALAILTYNKEDDSFLFRSYLQNGQSADFKAEMIDKKLYWYPNENVRYIVWLNKEGQWHEIGEFKRGDDWFQFFEMTLDKK